MKVYEVLSGDENEVMMAKLLKSKGYTVGTEKLRNKPVLSVRRVGVRTHSSGYGRIVWNAKTEDWIGDIIGSQGHKMVNTVRGSEKDMLGMLADWFWVKDPVKESLDGGQLRGMLGQLLLKAKIKHYFDIFRGETVINLPLPGAKHVRIQNDKGDRWKFIVVGECDKGYFVLRRYTGMDEKSVIEHAKHELNPGEEQQAKDAAASREAYKTKKISEMEEKEFHNEMVLKLLKKNGIDASYTGPSSRSVVVRLGKGKKAFVDFDEDTDEGVDHTYHIEFFNGDKRLFAAWGLDFDEIIGELRKNLVTEEEEEDTEINGVKPPLIWRAIKHLCDRHITVFSHLSGADGIWTINKDHKVVSYNKYQSWEVKVKFADGKSTSFEILPKDDDALDLVPFEDEDSYEVRLRPGEKFDL